jgi:beta-N-acetylhexosaminidase
MKNRRSFIVGIKSFILLNNEKKFLKKYKPWGVILFSRNIKNINQTKKLTDSIRKIFKDDKYPILVDQEGGRVSRFDSMISTTNFTADFFGKLYKNNFKKFKIYYRIFIDQNCYLMNKLGININNIPVLDVKRNKFNNIIGDRSYSINPRVVSKIGDFCIKGFHKNNIGTVIKHIPGHGLTNVDSHSFTPKVSNKLRQLIKNDFFPFKKKSSFFAMTAHIIYQDIDKDFTATHSSKVIKLIRNSIKFKNILISDDITMKSLRFGIRQNTIKAFEAGCNLVLHCNGNYSEMIIVAKNSPLINNFIIKKTSQFYKILS